MELLGVWFFPFTVYIYVELDCLEVDNRLKGSHLNSVLLNPTDRFRITDFDEMAVKYSDITTLSQSGPGSNPASDSNHEYLDLHESGESYYYSVIRPNVYEEIVDKRKNGGGCHVTPDVTITTGSQSPYQELQKQHGETRESVENPYTGLIEIVGLDGNKESPAIALKDNKRKKQKQNVGRCCKRSHIVCFFFVCFVVAAILASVVGYYLGTKDNGYKRCPVDYEYLTEAKGCYLLLYEELNWDDAGLRCQMTHPEAHLVVINSAVENDAIARYIKYGLSKQQNSSICTNDRVYKNERFVWTSGQRVGRQRCSDPFVWKPFTNSTTSLNFTNWDRNEPNCKYNGTEACIHLWAKSSFKWNDGQCSLDMCPLCQISSI